MKESSDFDLILKDILGEFTFEDKSFFKSLKQGNFNKKSFIKGQYQFYYAVIHFTTPLALIAGSIPTYEERVNIIKNLWEEHGEGNLAHTHGATFNEFLRRLDRSEELTHPTPKKAVLDFNQTLTNVSRHDHFLKGVAMIGIIERMFSDISHFIGQNIVAQGWLKEEEMIHYSLHKELDVIHAEDFFRILRVHWHESNAPIIKDGLKVGASCFLKLYEDIWKEVQ